MKIGFFEIKIRTNCDGLVNLFIWTLLFVEISIRPSMLPRATEVFLLSIESARSSILQYWTFVDWTRLFLQHKKWRTTWLFTESARTINFFMNANLCNYFFISNLANDDDIVHYWRRNVLFSFVTYAKTDGFSLTDIEWTWLKIEKC